MKRRVFSRMYTREVTEARLRSPRNVEGARRPAARRTLALHHYRWRVIDPSFRRSPCRSIASHPSTIPHRRLRPRPARSAGARQCRPRARDRPPTTCAAAFVGRSGIRTARCSATATRGGRAHEAGHPLRAARHDRRAMGGLGSRRACTGSAFDAAADRRTGPHGAGTGQLRGVGTHQLAITVPHFPRETIRHDSATRDFQPV